ncbi:MAG: protein kinase domain-containing protein [Nannocystales bacterium]
MAGPTTPTATDSGLVAGDGGWTTPPAEGPRRGASFGRYVVLHEIGSGGMGVVYAAYDPELDRRVALKVLGEAAGTDTGRARLLREAQTMARLSHPNVITVHDVGEVEGRLFIAMELVAGCDLKRWLEETRPWQDVLSVLLQAGRGLAAAHDQGLIHRDFKPANVLVGDDGLVRVLDFGLARRFGQVDEPPTGDTSDLDLSSSHNSHTEQLTQTGAIAGTPAYMSPEQHARGELDGKSDQFSFCVTAFEALFGERPFDGNGRMALMLQATQGERRPIPKSTQVPGRICEAIVRGLQPKPSERWPHMRGLLEQLERRPASHRNIALGATALVGLAGVVAVSLEHESDPPCPPLTSLRAGLLPDEIRGEIRGAFTGTGVPFADQALVHTLNTADAYADEWSRARLETCEATRVRHDRSENLHDRSVACLDALRRDFDATLDVLAEAKAQTVEKSVALLGNLRPVQGCADAEALLEAYPAPAPELAESVEAAEALLSRGRALLGARRDGDALEALRQADEAATSSTHPPTMAAASLEFSIALSRNSQRELATEKFHGAGQLAARLGDDRLLTRTWIEMGRHLFHAESAHAEALRWFDYAEAVLARVPDAYTLELDLREARGSALSEQGKFKEALAELDTLDSHRPPGKKRAWGEEVLRANIHTWQGDYSAAEAAFGRATERALETMGEDHPVFAGIHNGLGTVAFSRGDLAAAEAGFRRAHEIMRAALPDDSQDLLFSLGNIGEIQRMRGNHEAAHETMLAVERLVKNAFPPVHREVGTTNHNIASNYREWGKLEESLLRYDVAIDVRREIHGARHVYVSNSLTGKGLALLDLGRTGEALPLLEEALSIRSETGAPPRKRARTEFGLARALALTSGDMTRARSLATAARDRLRDQNDDTAADRITKIDAWLSEHGVEMGAEPTPPAQP